MVSVTFKNHLLRTSKHWNVKTTLKQFDIVTKQIVLIDPYILKWVCSLFTLND